MSFIICQYVSHVACYIYNILYDGYCVLNSLQSNGIKFKTLFQNFHIRFSIVKCIAFSIQDAFTPF